MKPIDYLPMDTENTQSPRWWLNAEDVKKWFHNTAIFLAPLALIYFAPVAANLQDGVALSDFAVTPLMQGAIALYIVNAVMDFFRKLIAGQR